MTDHEKAIEYIAGVFDDVAEAGGTHVDDDHASGPGELSPDACRLAARFVRRLAERPRAFTAENDARVDAMLRETRKGES